MIPKYRKPVSPGEVLLKEFLDPLCLSQVELARRMNVPIQRVNIIIKGKRIPRSAAHGTTAETAVLLSRALNTSVEFWMNLQVACDIYKAEKELEIVT